MADLEAAAGVLLDHDDRDAGLVDLPAADEHLVLERRRQAGRRLVEQQHRRAHHQGPAHGHHLALAARQRAGPLLAPLAQEGEEVAHLLEALREVARALVAAHLEVLLDGEPGEHVVVLRHVADAEPDEPVGLGRGDVGAPQGDRPAAHRHEAEERLEQRGLAGAVGPDDADQLAGVELEVAAVEDVDAGHVAGDEGVGREQGAVPGRLGDLLQLQLGGGGRLRRVGQEGLVSHGGPRRRARPLRGWRLPPPRASAAPLRRREGRRGGPRGRRRSPAGWR